MPNDQPKRARWTGWIIGGIVLLVLYLASMGPFCLLAEVCFDRGYGTAETWRGVGDVLYWPIRSAYDHGPAPVREAIDRYATFWNQLAD